MAKRHEFTDRLTTQAYGAHVEDQRAAAGTVWLEEDQQFIDSFLDLVPEGGAILDVGAGTGNQANYFAQHGFSVSMTEGTQAMLDAARQVSGAEGRVGVLPDIPYDNEQFDGVFSRHVLHHLSFPNVATSISNMARVARRGGHIALIMSVSTDAETHHNWYHIGGGDQLQRNFYPVTDLQAVATELGLSAVSEDVSGRGESANPIYRVILQK